MKVQDSNNYQNPNDSIKETTTNSNSNVKEVDKTNNYLKKLLVVAGIVMFIMLMGLIVTTIIAVKNSNEVDSNSINMEDILTLLGISAETTDTDSTSTDDTDDTDEIDTETATRLITILARYSKLSNALEEEGLDSDADLDEDNNISFRTTSSQETADSYVSQLNALKDDYLSDNMVSELGLSDSQLELINEFKSTISNLGTETLNAVVKTKVEERRRFLKTYTGADYWLWSDVKYWSCYHRIFLGCEYCDSSNWMAAYPKSACQGVKCPYEYQMNICNCDKGIGCYLPTQCWIETAGYNNYGICVSRSLYATLKGTKYQYLWDQLTG